MSSPVFYDTDSGFMSPGSPPRSPGFGEYYFRFSERNVRAIEAANFLHEKADMMSAKLTPRSKSPPPPRPPPPNNRTMSSPVEDRYDLQDALSAATPQSAPIDRINRGLSQKQRAPTPTLRVLVADTEIKDFAFSVHNSSYLPIPSPAVLKRFAEIMLQSSQVTNKKSNTFDQTELSAGDVVEELTVRKISEPTRSFRRSKKGKRPRMTTILGWSARKRSLSGIPSDLEMDILESEADVPEKNRFRLLVLGSTKVGKSNVVNRFLYNTFSERYMPTIENFYKKIYRIRGELFMLEVLDTSGYNPFPAMKRISLQTGDLFMLVFSLTCPESFEEVKSLRRQIVEAKTTNSKYLNAPPIDKRTAKVPIVIVGNKADEVDDIIITEREIQDYLDGEAVQCPYVMCSAKDDYGVEQSFFELFMMAHLPVEMSPSHHRRLSPSLLSAPPAESLAGRLQSFRRRFSNVGMMSPVPRRPSVKTDMKMAQQKRDADMTDSGHAQKQGSPNSRNNKRCVIS